MPKPYFLRKQMLKDDAEDLVQHYNMSRSCLYALIQQRRDIGSIAPSNYFKYAGCQNINTS